MEIAILLATYNGEKYLAEQLDSLLYQSFSNFKIYISDDCSTDNTQEIINNYVTRFSNRIVDLNNTERFGSAKKNFINLLYKVNADVYFFCDQDDVWKNDHVEKLLNLYKLENMDEPILIHSDLTVVDKDLKVLAKSFFKYSKLPLRQNKRLYFLQNNVTGCACLINNTLKQLIFLDNKFLYANFESIPMHDIFFAVTASYFGKIIFINECLVNYRQHGKNVVGAKSVDSFSYIKTKILGKKSSGNNNSFINFFCLYYDKQLELKEKEILRQFMNLTNKMKIYRWLFLIKYGFLKTGIKRKIYQLLTI